MAGEETTNIRQENNVAQTGLNLDRSVNQVQKGQLTYALNAAVENFDANSVNYQNEPGNELCLNFPEDYHIIGTHSIIEQNKHIFFLTNPNTGDSEIGYMDNNDCVYHTYINGKCLNFSINYPIHKVVHKITNCTTEIYWTDGINPRRYLNIEDVTSAYLIQPGTNVCDNETIPQLDCNKLKLQPNFSIPQLEVVDVVNGGDLIAGTYQFAIQYSNATGDGYTSYYSVTNPTPIAITTITTPEFNYSVGRSIVLDIKNLDVTGYFKYYNLAVIKTVNDITSVELVGTYFIDDNFNQVTYSGQNQTQIRLTLNDIFEKFPFYEIAQDLTAVQDVLVWDNLTSIDRINYQKIANQISLKWQTYKLPADEDYSDPINATNLRGYLRDEVYAFEIVFLLDNGKQTDGFHIPGRVRNANDFTQPDVQNTNPDFIGDGTSAPYWKIYNTASVIGPATGPNIGNATPYEYGEFAYWESTDVYPCNEDVWGDLANTPIRHHKFPDVLVSPIFESGTPTINYDGTYTNLKMQDAAVYPIGVLVDVQQVYQLINSSSLTQDQKSSIVGFKIVRGNRSTNYSIISKGILRNLGEYEREETSYYFPNYPYNDLRTDPFLLKENNAFDAVCREYEIIVTASGDLNYYSCDTGLLVTEAVTNGQVLNLCSTSFPEFSNSAAGTITATDYKTYALCTNANAAGNRFSYYPPDSKDPAVIWVSGQLFSSNCEYVNSITEPVQVEGSGRYSITAISTSKGVLDCTVSVDQLDAFKNTKSPYRFVFNSPETSFGKPFLGSVLKLESAIYGAGSAHFVQVSKNAMYKLITKEAQQDALKSSSDIANITSTFDPTAMFTAYQAYLQIYINGITRKNYAKSYNSIAKYNYWAPIDNGLGIKQRDLDICQYLIPGVQNVGDDLNVNNFNRESSVYIKTIDERDSSTVPSLPYPSNTPSLLIGGTIPAIEDKSRFTLSEKGNCNNPEKEFEITTVTYYGSIKNIARNQWGQIYSYETIDTGYQNLISEGSGVGIVFGGDTFINKFSFKTKLPFFIDNRVNAPDDSDIFYDEIGNVAYPKYWHSARSVLSDYTVPYGSDPVMKNIISFKAHNFDCPNSQAEGSPGRTFYDGSFYLFAYGIPTFYCESSVNVDLRQAFNNREGDFFPHVSTGIPDNWLQESYVSIAQDNTYYYNPTFSKQNKENSFSHLPIDWTEQLCYTNFPFRAIYSDRQQSFTDNRVNSWLIYRPISFFDFPQNYGDLISLDGIQNRAVLARFENKSLLYNTLLTVSTSNPQAAYLGNDTLFRSAPPIDFAETDLGYVGCQNKMLLKIPQGQVTVDAKRGQVFLIAGNQATDLSGFGSGLNRFFTDHLAFEILRYFPNISTDNHFNGIGLHGVYDSKYDRVILTKLDYIPTTDDVKYDSVKNEFYIDRLVGNSTIRTVVDLNDQDFFCNKSWTLSFNFNTNSWISFHSYIPNWYIGENNFFYSGINGGCDLDAIAAEEVSCTPRCDLKGNARIENCNLEGIADVIDCNIVGYAEQYAPECDLEGHANLGECMLEGNSQIIACYLEGESQLIACYLDGNAEIVIDCNFTGDIEYVPVVPECADKIFVFQVCNSNAVRDDNFDVYLNNTYIGALDLNANAQIGSLFIGNTNPAFNVMEPDFVCPIENMQVYRFDPSILLGTGNVLEMRNTQRNGSGNYGVFEARNYERVFTDLINPCEVTNLSYYGYNGQSFTFNFDYPACCPDLSNKSIEIDFLVTNPSETATLYFEDSFSSQTMTINWGDSLSDTGTVNTTFTHTYTTPGTYTATITFATNITHVDFALINGSGTTKITDTRGFDQLDAMYGTRITGVNSPISDLSLPINNQFITLRNYSLPVLDFTSSQFVNLGELVIESSLITSLTLAPTFNLYNIEISGSNLTTLDISNCTNLDDIYIVNNPLLASITLPATLANTNWVYLSGNALDQASVDDILVKLAANTKLGGTCVINGGTNAAPSATGLAAKTTLQGRGWTVTTN